MPKLSAAMACIVAANLAGCGGKKSRKPTEPTPAPSSAFPLSIGNAWSYAWERRWISGSDTILAQADTLTIEVVDSLGGGWYGMESTYRDSILGARKAEFRFRATDSGLFTDGYVELAGAFPLFKAAAGPAGVTRLLPGKRQPGAWEIAGTKYQPRADTAFTWKGQSRKCQGLSISRDDRHIATLFFDPEIGVLAKHYAPDSISDSLGTVILESAMTLTSFKLKGAKP